MTIKRSVGIGFVAIVLLNLVLIGSEVLIAKKMDKVEMQLTRVLRLKDEFNNVITEHNVWLNNLTEHVMDGRSFDNGLELTGCPILVWLKANGIRDNHKHETRMLKTITATLSKQYDMARWIVGEDEIKAKRSIYIDILLPAIQELRPQASMYINHYNEEILEINTTIKQLTDRSRIFKIFASCFTIAAFAILAIFMNKTVLKPLDSISESMETVSAGDLSQSIEYNKNNEIGKIADNFNHMLSSLGDVTKGIHRAGTAIKTGVESLQANAEKTNESSKAQAAKSIQVATTSEEMSQTILDIARNASVASSSSNNAMKLATDGKQMAANTKEIEDRVFKATIELSTMMDRLSNKAGDIKSVVEVINDIADQTNLLALNAAIEAARAGEQGRGFGVVADEVRKLAERTLNATGEISTSIGEVVSEIGTTAKTMENVTSEVTKAATGINEVETSLLDIFSAVEDVTDKVNQIAASVEQQSSATEEVAQEMENSSNLSKDIEGLSVEVLKEINSLAEVAEKLDNSIEHFKL